LLMLISSLTLKLDGQIINRSEGRHTVRERRPPLLRPGQCFKDPSVGYRYMIHRSCPLLYEFTVLLRFHVVSSGNDCLFDGLGSDLPVHEIERGLGLLESAAVVCGDGLQLIAEEPLDALEPVVLIAQHAEFDILRLLQ
jgi:hypothetical protein